MKEIVTLVVGLAITCAVASSVLAVANRATAERRAAADAAQLRDALALVLPTTSGATLAESTELDGVVFYPLVKDGSPVAVAAKGTTGTGFGGSLSVLAGIDGDGRIISVIVMPGHKETPGLGTQATDRSKRRRIWDLFSGNHADAGGMAPNIYLDRYAGRSAGDIGKDAFKTTTNADEAAADPDGTVLGITGATVSSRAICAAMQTICRAYDSHRDTLAVATAAGN